MEKYPTSCPKCKKSYDFFRIPLLLPCQHSFCEECLMAHFSSEKKFLCFADEKTYDLNTKDLPIPYFYRLIPKSLYMCSKHKNEPMKFICEDHKEFLCNLCIWDHSDHKKSTKIYLEEDLLTDIQRVEEI